MRYNKKDKKVQHNYEFSLQIFANLRHLEGFNRQKGISFLKQGVVYGYHTQQKAKMSPAAKHETQIEYLSILHEATLR